MLKDADTRLQKRRAQDTPKAYGKVGNAMMQDNRIFAVMVGGYLAEFYTTAERRGTAMKKGIF